MRIYDLNADKKIDKVILYLTPDEAQQLKYALEQIIGDNKKHHHQHILDDDYKREITVCVYKDDNLATFDERSQRLIQQDE
ncbi:MAG: hypothetical protein FJZ56_05630 [Chlamydiae bacterium]|nr:hypothetical protein [Chlamydiota bacterium]